VMISGSPWRRPPSSLMFQNVQGRASIKLQRKFEFRRRTG
jgi:hypothetical protein